MKKSVFILAIVLLLIGGLVYTALCGIGDFIQPVDKGIVPGLDLVGGSEITYEAVVPDGFSSENLSNGMEVAKTMIQERLDFLGYSEGNAYQSGSNRIVVEIPAVDDPEDAAAKLGATAVVTFIDADGKEWLSGKDIVSADYGNYTNDTTGQNAYQVELQLTDEGRGKLRDASNAIRVRASEGKNYLSIQLDGETISSPGIDKDTVLDTNTVSISPISTREEAKQLANIISAGRLPFELTRAKQQTVGASLGARSLHTSLVAGLIGLILVMIFMIAVYRLMGVISCIALIAYAALFAVALSIFHVNLSLPGIAGIILTIGMAVDANVIIYERIKEEIRVGKTLRYAVESGYKHAVIAIVDANITTMIAGAVLLWQGSGTILGFSRTLLIGVVLSMIVMLLLTKLLLKTAIGLKLTNLKLYCVDRKEKAE